MSRLKRGLDLERSDVVANCPMNRQRTLHGSNGYDRDLGLDVWACLRARPHPRWLDLCCGTGGALRAAADRLCAQAAPADLVGVDLVGDAPPHPGVRWVEANVERWDPEERFDLITCVHGLHYVGDRLGLIARACAWLTPDGVFCANFDAGAVQLQGGSARQVARWLREGGVDYDARRKRLRCEGPRTLRVPWDYVGADDTVGPNYTGQPGVIAVYRSVE